MADERPCARTVAASVAARGVGGGSHRSCAIARATREVSPGVPSRRGAPAQPSASRSWPQSGRARAARSRDEWDARLETSAIAVLGYLWRQGGGGSGRALRLARYACSIAQLVMGLAEIMGWRRFPTAQQGGGCAGVKAHRASVQRWLDWLQHAGLVSHTPQQDEEGFWWRTVIELHPLPAAAGGAAPGGRGAARGCRRASAAAGPRPPARTDGDPAPRAVSRSERRARALLRRKVPSATLSASGCARRWPTASRRRSDHI